MQSSSSTILEKFLLQIETASYPPPNGRAQGWLEEAIPSQTPPSAAKNGFLF